MSYIDGFVAAVPQENKQALSRPCPCGAVPVQGPRHDALVENDVPEGKVTDFHRSVQKKDGEAVLFSWVEGRRRTCATPA
jgi:uncharacterized protein YbaA (DUF1428 family)